MARNEDRHSQVRIRVPCMPASQERTPKPEWITAVKSYARMEMGTCYNVLRSQDSRNHKTDPTQSR